MRIGLQTSFLLNNAAFHQKVVPDHLIGGGVREGWVC
jgi:hypothetical protein